MSGEQKTFSKVSEKLRLLPVNRVIPDVVDAVEAGKITVLTADTGSGKTLLGSAALADASEDPVVVLVPRRYLAINAAETIAELGELELGKEVGFAIGKQAGDESKFGKDTKLLFTTYGYALESGLVHTAKNIIVDEVHEQGDDISLARAVLHKRLETDKDLNVLEMSATVNAEKQAAYYTKDKNGRPTGKRTAIFHAEGQAQPCETRHIVPKPVSVKERKESFIDPETSELAALALDMVQGKHPLEETDKKEREGILIFRPGIKEINDLQFALMEECQKRDLKNVEIASVSGDMEMEQRDAATAPPAEGNVKILIGTNVIESGVTIPWADTGISDGKTRIPYHHASQSFDIEELRLTNLPVWRIKQQEGRVKRMQPGVFVLFAERGLSEERDPAAEVEADAPTTSNPDKKAPPGRPLQQTPEITRTSPKTLLMRCANLGLDHETLTFDARINEKNLEKAKDDLQRLGLLDKDLQLTEKGQFTVDLPVTPEAGAMLYAAVAKDDIRILPDAVELAAMMGVKGFKARGGIVADYDETAETEGAQQPGQAEDPHANYRTRFKMHKNSDMLDSLRAYQKVAYDPARQSEEELQKHCEETGITWKAFKEVRGLVKDINRRLGIEQWPLEEKWDDRPQASDIELQKLMLHGSLNKLFVLSNGEAKSLLTIPPQQAAQRGQRQPKQKQGGNPHEGKTFEISSGAVNKQMHDRFVIADLRETTANGVKAINVTCIPDEALLEFAAENPGVLGNVHKVASHRTQGVEATYMGRSRIEFPLRNKGQQPEAMQKFLDANKVDAKGPASRRFASSKRDKRGNRIPANDGDTRQQQESWVERTSRGRQRSGQRGRG